MAASVSGQEPGRVPGQAKTDVLLVGGGAVQLLADAVRESFSNLGDVTVTVGDVQGAAELLAERDFHLVFLRVTSPGEREAAGSLRMHFGVRLFPVPPAPDFQVAGSRPPRGHFHRDTPLRPQSRLVGRFGRKKNTHFLFVFIIPENFKGLGADITVTEPLTTEKLSVVGEYWRTRLAHAANSESSVAAEGRGPPQRESCRGPRGCSSADLLTRSKSLRNDIGLEPKAPLSDLERSKRISLLHSSKEKLRRERIKQSCEQLRALVPGGKGRKNDAASVLEATVEHVRRVRDRIPPAVLGQIAEALQSNSRFCRKQAPFPLPPPGPAPAPRESSVLASTCPPMREISFLANRCLNAHPAPASGGPADGVVRGPPGPTPEKAAGEVRSGQAPSPAPSLGSFHAIRGCPIVVPTWDAAATANQSETGPLPGPRAPMCPAPLCSCSLGQACAAPPTRLRSLWAHPQPAAGTHSPDPLAGEG